MKLQPHLRVIMQHKTGSTIQSKSKNKYAVLAACEKYMHLECIDFIEEDDLGDGIMCQRKGSKFWVAQYHAGLFTVLEENRPA